MSRVVVDLKLSGDKAVRRKIQRLQRTIPSAVNAAVYEEAAVSVFIPSQLEVPVDTGRLRASGILAPSGTVVDFVAIVAYGTDYALPVHERHKAYLMDPFVRAQPGMMKRIAARAETNVRTMRFSDPTKQRGKKMGTD